MYPRYRDGIEVDCRESFSLPWLMGENLLHLSQWVIAGALAWPLKVNGWPVVTMVWAAAVMLIQILLKKHICSGCYYYGKACHLGWGKLSALLFRRDAGNIETGMRMALFYVISPPLFVLAGLAVGIILAPGNWYWGLLAAYVSLAALSLPVRKRSCRLCAMRKVCPGSAARDDFGQ